MNQNTFVNKIVKYHYFIVKIIFVPKYVIYFLLFY